MWYRLNGLPSPTEFVGNHFHVFKVKVKEESICILLKNQRVYAYREACPHAGKTLLHSTCSQENELVCLFHNYKFSLEDGRCTNNNEGYKLRFLATKMSPEGDILVEV